MRKPQLPVAVTALSALLLSLGVAGSACAQSAGQWTVEAGLKKIDPKVKSGYLTAPAPPGVQNAVGSDTEPALTIGYMFTDHIGVETFISMPFKHDQIGAGSIQGTGVVGTVESLPATVLLKYRFFEPTAQFRPSLAIGPTYGYFQNERGSAQLTAITNPGSATATTFKADHNWGVTLEMGLGIAIKGNWYANISVAKTYIKTTSHFSTGQTVDLTLDPVTTSASIGYRF